MTIRTQLLSLAGLLSLLLIILCGSNAWDAYGRLNDIRATAAINRFSDDMLVAAGAWAVERGTTNAVLGAPAAFTDAQAKTVADQRRAADAASARALDHARTLNDPKLKASIAAAEEALTRLGALRRRVDAVFAARALGADAALRAEWFPGISAVIERTQALRQSLEADLPPTHPIIADGFTLKQGAFLASEYAGRERGFLAGVIAANRPLTPAEIAQVGANRGQIDAG